ncbi:MAG: hypothetical protein J6S67_20305 [Methanobrevibacter sp.]|nr:hypothetical protein [Clostridia bacterium]MBO7734915.1 hypothetical protein [Methanobrevibacter sp.]
MKQYNEKLLFFALCGICFLILFRIIIALTELDSATFARQAEYEKLRYFQTLNKVYGDLSPIPGDIEPYKGGSLEKDTGNK